MPSRTRILRSAAKYLIATLLALLLVSLLAAFGNLQLSQSPSSISNFSAYPLPGTPIPGGSGPVATPTRLAAYPLPGASPTPPRPNTPTGPLTYTAFLPLVLRPVGAKGTAGIITARPLPSAVGDPGFTNEITMGVQWGYNWNQVFTWTNDIYSSTFPYQVVNDVRSKSAMVWDIHLDGSCPGDNSDMYDPSPSVQAARQACVSDIAHHRPGLYWMIWNEPDLGGTDNDGVTPTLAAQYFKTISDTILGADPTARLIVGNVGVEYAPNPMTDCFGHGCGVYWLTQFVSAYTTTYGIDPRLAMAGYGIHAYSMGDKRGLGLTNCSSIYSSASDPCLLTAFTSTVQIGTQWLANNDPGKELWLTEVNWEYGPQQNRDTWTLQISRSIQICASLATYVANGDIQRYSWWFGEYPFTTSAVSLITPSLYLADISGSSVIYTGSLSPGGQQFISC